MESCESNLRIFQTTSFFPYSYHIGEIHRARDNGIRFYRFATVGETPSRLPGGENKGNTIFYPEEFFSRDLSGQSAFSNFVSTNSHEIYHSWNLFHSSVNGILSEWLAEGGAKFIAAWAIEKIIGVDEGVMVREAYLMGYLENEGYRSTEPLAARAVIEKHRGISE